MVVPVFLAFGALKPCSAKFPSKTAFLKKKSVGNSLLIIEYNLQEENTLRF